MCRQNPGPRLYRVWDTEVQGPGSALVLRFYQPNADPPSTGIMFVHGGGFTVGGLDTHDPQCRWLARYSGSVVVAVDYRLAPEHPFPAALEDCMAAWNWLSMNRQLPKFGSLNWACAGDSAGANLAIALAHRFREQPWRPVALALFYPFLDPSCETHSARVLAEGPGLSRDAMLWFWENYLGPERRAPAAELLGRDLSALPPTSLFLAAADPLVDEGLALADALVRAGVPLNCRIYDGMVHGFLHLGALTPKADEALREAANDLRFALGAVRPNEPLR